MNFDHHQKQEKSFSPTIFFFFIYSHESLSLSLIQTYIQHALLE